MARQFLTSLTTSEGLVTGGVFSLIELDDLPGGGVDVITIGEAITAGDASGKLLYESLTGTLQETAGYRVDQAVSGMIVSNLNTGTVATEPTFANGEWTMYLDETTVYGPTLKILGRGSDGVLFDYKPRLAFGLPIAGPGTSTNDDGSVCYQNTGGNLDQAAPGVFTYTETTGMLRSPSHVTTAVAAQTAGDFNNSEVAMWLDDTAGSPKIHFRGKDAAGTVFDFTPGSGIGTVTSVNLTAPAAGITVSGGPVTTSGSITLALADDLAALEALTGTNTIYYRSGVSTWTAVTIGSGLSFAAGTLTSTGSGGSVTSVNLTAPAAGITVSGGPITTSGSITLALADDLAAVEGLASTGIAVRTAASTWTTRTLTGPAAGISVSNGDGVAGNPTLALANDLAAVEGLASTGMVARTASDTWTTRTIAGTASRISVSNGDGVAAAPTIDIDAAYVGQTSITTLGTIATGTWSATTIAVDKGGTGQTSYTNGQLLIGNTTGNTLVKGTLTAPAAGITITGGAGSITFALADDLAALETLSGTNTIYYRSGVSTWTAVTIGTGLSFSAGTLSSTITGTVTSVNVSGGTTGLTFSGGPITSSGTITMAGTLAVLNGGTGSTTASGARTNLGLGTAATQNTGTSGANVPLLNGANSWSGAQTFINSSGIKILDTDASNTLGIVGGSNLTLDRTLTITTGDANRTITLNGDTTLSGTNTGDQTITLTGDVTGSGTGSFAATIASNAVTDAKLRQGTACTVIGRSANSTGNVADIAAASNGLFLQRTANALTFAVIAASDVPAFTNFTDTAPDVADQVPLYDASAGGNRSSYVRNLMGVYRFAPGGRLTLTSGTPVTTADTTSSGSLYYTPYLHDTISLWDGTQWALIRFTEYTISHGTMTASTPYDIFAYASGGVFAMEMLAWTNATTRATAITVQDGRYCKSGDKTRLYIGTIYPATTTTIVDSVTKRFVWNMYNRVPRPLFKAETGTSNWNYTTASWRSANNSTANRVEIIRGLNEDAVMLELLSSSQSSAGATTSAGIGLDSTTAPTGASPLLGGGGVAYYQSGTAAYDGFPGLGYHYFQALEYGGTSASFFGNNSPFQSCALYGNVLA